MSITILQIHKRSSYQFKNIQDKFAVNEVNKCFALADGTTQSFNSEIWAEIITKNFVANPTFDWQKLIANFASYVPEYKNSKFEFSVNLAKASLERTKQLKGGTATFFGLQFLQNNKCNVISCGDSNLFIISNDIIDHFPYSDVDKLDANKYFINTEQLLQCKIEGTFFQSKTFTFQTNDILIIATDALSRLLLKQPNVISELTALKDFESLHQLCLKYWDKKELEEDDISAVIIIFENKNSIKTIFPSKDFSFPIEKQQEFILTSHPQTNKDNFTTMNMQEIKHYFNSIATDFFQVKKKMKLHEMLLMIAISIGILNLFCFFYFRPETDKSDNENSSSKNQSTIIEGINQSLQDLGNKIESLEKRAIQLPVLVKEKVKNANENLPKSVNSGIKEKKKNPKGSKKMSIGEAVEEQRQDPVKKEPMDSVKIY